MPVIPENVPRFIIHPPMTAGDKGVPTKSLTQDAERVFAFIEDERHLIAHELYTSVRQRIQEWEEKRREDEQAKKQKPRGLLFRHRQYAAHAKEAEEKEKKQQDDVLEAKTMLDDKKDVIDKLEVGECCEAVGHTACAYVNKTELKN